RRHPLGRGRLGPLGRRLRLGADRMSTETALREPWRPWGFIRRFLLNAGISGRSAVIAPPMLWLAMFFLVPLAVILKISFSAAVTARPPYLPLLVFSDDSSVQLTLHLSNFLYLF